MSEARNSFDEVSRRTFLAAGAGSLALNVVASCCGQAGTKLGDHHVPADKNLHKAWVEQLFAHGQRKVYRGDELTCIGMPIGGICAGQLYLRGDGTLADWHLFNHNHFTGYGDTSYRTYTPPAPVQQGFAIWAKPQDGQPVYRTLDRASFPDVEFVGEYPIGRVRYPRPANDALPVKVSLEAFSPFVPLDARTSATPGTVLRFTVRNTSDKPVEAALCGWLQNVVCQQHVGKLRGRGRNVVERPAPGMTTLQLSAEPAPAPKPVAVQPPQVFADFESGTYDGWTKTGTAFGDRPATGTFPHQQPVTGFGGKYLVNTYNDDDRHTGTLTSGSFTIDRPYINFRIGGGNHPGKECLNLLVDGKVVRTATGRNLEKLEWDFWDVADLQGQKARLEIVDKETGGWGHINIDDIQFADEPPKQSRVAPLTKQADFGTLALSVLDTDATASTDGFEAFRSAGSLRDRSPQATAFPLGQNKLGALASRFNLPPGGSHEVVFLVTWHFAQPPHGRMYGHWFKDAAAVAVHLKEKLEQLTEATRLFHDTYYNSTLPHWLLDRLLMPLTTLATDTCQWWANGRFWAWEGVGCCDGTCTHVWNYAQGMAYLFPELERSAREHQDLSAGFDPKTGRVGFRGENPNEPYAADGQCGTVLKCYREHRMSADDQFLKRNWPRIKKVMEYEIGRDGNGDGVIEDKQWNTFDLDFIGPNTFVGALYLAALEAAARMAEHVGDKAFAERCRAIAAKGSDWTRKNLYNGEYFIQRIPKGLSDQHQYGIGCLSDQLFGQNWADQLDLGYLYPVDRVRTALMAIYKYNWAPDVAAQNKA
ncbi:MAG TPA: GH116 family glycosyl hydrolase, partial [Gemmataceae bacterium]|nr:GH116 family glycosyl hydrolase [Gemmataceae bacterium]